MRKSVCTRTLYVFIVFSRPSNKITCEIFFSQRMKVNINHHPSTLGNLQLVFYNICTQ